MESGLPSARVHHLVETSTGVLWAVTNQGLAWYNGYRWHTPEINHLSEERPTYVSADLTGGILFTVNGDLYQGNEHGFRHVELIYKGEPVMAHDAISLNHEDILFTGSQRLFLYRPQGITLFDLPEDRHVEEALLEGSVQLFRTENGRIWLNAPMGLYKWAGKQWEKHLDTSVSQIIERDNLGYLITSSDPEQQGLWTWSSEGNVANELAEYITGFAISHQGTAIALLGSAEIMIKTGEGWVRNPDVPAYLARAQFAYFQKNGDLWVGLSDGLYRQRLSSKRWQRKDLAGSHINELLITKNGDLWVATNEGVSIIHPDQSVEHVLYAGPKRIKHVTGLAEGPDGSIWVSSGSTFEGVYRWKNNTWSHVELEEGPADVYVHKIEKDTRGNLWFMGLSMVENDQLISRESGAYQYVDGRFKKWARNEGLPSGRVYAFMEYPAGTYWFGTEGGLSRWTDGAWKHWNRDPDLGKSRVITMEVAPDGRIWFSHWSQGIAYLDEEEQIHCLMEEDGLVDDRVREIRTGPDGTLWISTHNGISLLKDDVFFSIGRTDGLAHSDVWPVLPFEEYSLVGTIGGGLYTLNLSEYKQPPPQVTIHHAMVEERSVHLRWDAFSWQGIQRNKEIMTRYRLDNQAWSPWNRIRSLDAIEVPTGSHVFTVQAATPFNHAAAASMTARFTIPHPYYRKPLFLIFLITWIVATLSAGIVYWRKHAKYLEAVKYQALLLGEVHDSVISTTMDGIITTWNPGAERTYGYTAREAIGKDISLIYFKEDHDRLNKKITRELIEKGSSDYVMRNRHKTGKAIHVGVRLKIIYDYGNKPVGIIGCSNDITARRSEEEARKRSESLLQKAQSLAHLGSWEWMIEENSMVWSREALKILGNPLPEHTKTLDDFLDFIPVSGRKFVYQHLQWALHDHRPFKLEHRILQKNQSERIVLLRGEVVRDDLGKVVRVVGTLQDITKQKKIERKLIEARDEAEEMHRLKNSFLANMSHEIRTPLNAILGFAHLLAEEIPPEKTDLVQPIITGGERLLQTLNSILDLSMLEAGAFEMKLERLDMCPIVAAIVERYQLLASEKGLDLRIYMPSNPVHADTDQICLDRIISNLLSNAIKFTHSGHIDVTMYDEQKFVVISIQDTGSGISPTFLPHLFKAFKQESDGKARIHEGNGLGLTITKELVTLLGGEISIESIKHEGTVFTVTLPRFSSSPSVEKNPVPLIQ